MAKRCGKIQEEILKIENDFENAKEKHKSEVGKRSSEIQELMGNIGRGLHREKVECKAYVDPETNKIQKAVRLDTNEEIKDPGNPIMNLEMPKGKKLESIVNDIPGRKFKFLNPENKWVDVEFWKIRKDNHFRIILENGSQFKDDSGCGYFRAKNTPKKNDKGIWCIDVDALIENPESPRNEQKGKK